MGSLSLDRVTADWEIVWYAFNRMFQSVVCLNFIRQRWWFHTVRGAHCSAERPQFMTWFVIVCLKKTTSGSKSWTLYTEGTYWWLWYESYAIFIFTNRVCSLFSSKFLVDKNYPVLHLCNYLFCLTFGHWQLAQMLLYFKYCEIYPFNMSGSNTPSHVRATLSRTALWLYWILASMWWRDLSGVLFAGLADLLTSCFPEDLLHHNIYWQCDINHVQHWLISSKLPIPTSILHFSGWGFMFW